MYQGQLCRIEPNPAAGGDLNSVVISAPGWFQKLRSENGDTFYYLIDENRQKDVTISLALVDDSMENKFPNRPYRIVCVLPTNLQVEATMVKPDIERLAALAAINEKLDHLKKERSRLYAKCDDIEKLYRNSIDAVEKQNVQIRELEAIARATLPGTVPEFVYAYAKHTADGPMFCWRVPDGLKSVVFRGSTIVVDTKFGQASAIVVHIKKSPYLLDHKMVIRVED